MILLVDYLCELRAHLDKLPFIPKFIPKTLKIVDAKNGNSLFCMTSQEDLRRVDSLPTIVNAFVDINTHMVSDVSLLDDSTVHIEVKPSNIILTINDIIDSSRSLVGSNESWDDAIVAIRKYHSGELYGVGAVQRIGCVGKPCIVITASDYTMKLLEEK